MQQWQIKQWQWQIWRFFLWVVIWIFRWWLGGTLLLLLLLLLVGCFEMVVVVFVVWWFPSSSFGGLLWNGLWWSWGCGSDGDGGWVVLGWCFSFFFWVVVEVGKRKSLSRTMVRENKIKHNVINNYQNYVNIHNYGNKCVYLHIYTMWVVLG